MKDKLIAEIIELLKNPTYENVELASTYIYCLKRVLINAGTRRKK